MLANPITKSIIGIKMTKFTNLIFKFKQKKKKKKKIRLSHTNLIYKILHFQKFINIILSNTNKTFLNKFLLLKVFSLLLIKFYFPIWNMI